MKKILKRIIAYGAAFFAGAAALLTAFFAAKNKRSAVAVSKADAVRDKKRGEIETADSGALVGSADNADELCAIKNRLKEDNAQRISARIKVELFGDGS